MTVALLILVGGRQTPNLLTAQFLRPDLIVPVASHEALRPNEAWSRIKPALERLCTQVVEPLPVDAFDLESIRSACRTALMRAPTAQWVCNITCGTAIMSIGAYEAGREAGASVWYLDTARRVVKTLAGTAPAGNLYHLSVTDYLAIYGRQAHTPGHSPKPERLQLAGELARLPAAALDLRDSLRNASADRAHSRGFTLLNLSQSGQKLCRLATDAGMWQSQQVGSSSFKISAPASDVWTFFNGDWLELYVWQAARQAGCFDDVCYSVRIPGQYGENEIDLAATAAASLLIAECKTEEKPFNTETLDKLASIVAMLGGAYVLRMVILARPAHNGVQAFKAFQNQARERQVVIITGDQLVKLPQILQKEIARPSFAQR